MLLGIAGQADGAAPVAWPATAEAWTSLIGQALAHGVAALLCRRLLQAPAGSLAGTLPDDIAAAACAYLGEHEVAVAASIGQLADVLAALEAAGVPALPFKGPVFAAQAYGDPAARVSADLDLLIRPAQIAPALAVLDGLGYRSGVADLPPRRLRDYHRYNGQDVLVAPGLLAVEPHWALAPRTLGVALDTAPFWLRARPIGLHGHSLPCLSPEDALLVACLHGGKEEWSRLIWIADVAALLRRHPALDTAAVLRRASEAGLRRMVLLGLRLAADLLAAPLDQAMREAIAADPVTLRLADRVRMRLFAGGTESASVFRFTGFRWMLRERWADRLRYLAGTLLTARVAHFRSVDLPDALAFLYPAVRLGHDFVALPLWKALRPRQP
ncbi:MAG: nucleotidyltransferase family protein [Acetobacteraceae bacterium]